MEDYQEPERNFEDIENQSLREELDPKYNVAHDQLSEAYYNFWRQGESKDFQGYDVLQTPEENKFQFDTLHSLVFLMRDLEYLTRLDSEDNVEAIADLESQIAALNSNGFELSV